VSHDITLKDAERAVKAAIHAAQAVGVPMVIALVDSGGHLVLLKRMDGAIWGSVDIAINKAFTAAAYRVSTAQLAEKAQPGQALFGLHVCNGGRSVVFGGGIPLFKGGELSGSIGVSGGRVDQDVTVAEAGVKAYEAGASRHEKTTT
jgi:uncharacterized protein GlcG (DUF336 family)